MSESLLSPWACLLAAFLFLYLVQVVWFAGGMRSPCAPPHRPGSAACGPLVSVVVAARDEAGRIGACLADLLAQDWPPDRYEIIVVDDGSTDGTAQVVQCTGGERVLLLTAAAPGCPGSKKAALATGIRRSRGELILTTDAHCRIPPGWIRGLVGHFSPQVGLVAGFSASGTRGSARSPLAGYQAVDFLCLMGCILGSVGRGHPMAASGQSLAYRRAAFEQVGGYGRVAHRASGDDVLLLQLIRRHTPWRVAFAAEPGVRIVHPPCRSWRSLLGQRARWASNAPLQAAYDPLFFAFMGVTFTLSALLVASPVLVLAGALPPAWPAAALAAKVLAEYAFFRRAASRFDRLDLGRWFPLFAVLQPVHVVAAGVAGCLGIFTWKGERHRWGVQRGRARARAGT
ncbi:MAG: glycosyltransferase [Candidatus Latescibacterota bacterium]